MLFRSGLTSRDVTDNVELLQIRDSLRLVLRKSEALLLRLADISEKYAGLPMVGRTHNVPAQVTTLGKRFATWAEELLFSTQHCEELLERLPLRGIKGAIGTSLDQNELLGVAGNQIEGELISAWGFDSALTSTSQVYPRSIDFEVVSTIAQLAAAPSTIATNIRLMSGLGLLSEGFGKGQVGSSAMPHKVNPRLSERINSLAVILKGFVTMAAEISGEQWNEGDVSCSAVRRVFLPDSFSAIDAILDTTISVVDSLEIFENEIQAELHRHLPLLLSTKILMLAVKNGVGRERAHELIKGYSRNTDRNQFIAAVTSDSELKLDDLELKEILDKPLDLVGSAPQQAREVARSIRAKTFSHDSSIYSPELKN